MKSADVECQICKKVIDSDNIETRRNHLKTHKKSELIPYVSWWFVDKIEPKPEIKKMYEEWKKSRVNNSGGKTRRTKTK